MLLIFTSRNGAQRALAPMLASLRSLKPPPGGLEIVAVDSASQDNTGALLRTAGEALPLTVLSCAAPGKNLALNLALDHARERLCAHDLVVFTDDDVRADPDWLAAFAAARARLPDVDIFAGAIEPIFPHPPSVVLSGLEDQYDVLFAKLQREEGPCLTTQAFGPNLAISSKWFVEGHRFDASIGPNGQALFAMGSETEFLHRLGRAGARAWHVAGAKVGHMITAEQMEEDAVVRRAQRYGAGVVRLLDVSQKARTLRGVPLWLLRGYVQGAAQRALGAFARDGRTRLRARYNFAWYVGALAEAARQRRDRMRGAAHA